MSNVRSIVASAGAIAFFVLAQQTGSAVAASKLPQETVQKLIKLRGELDERSQKANAWVSQMGQYKSRLQQLRGLVTSDAKLRSTSAGASFLVALDGLELGRAALQGEAGLHQSAFEILGSVTQGLVGGEGYLDMDKRLLLLEKSEPKRDSTIGQLRGHFDKVDALIAVAESKSGGSDMQEVIKIGRLALASVRLTNNEVIANYEQVIKPATRSLRYLVDRTAK